MDINTIKEIAEKHVNNWCNDSTGTQTMYQVVVNAITEALQPAPMQFSVVAEDMHAAAAEQN